MQPVRQNPSPLIFIIQAILRIQNRFHTRERPYQDQKGRKAFLSSVDLKNTHDHQQGKTRLMQLMCEDFLTYLNLLNHMMIRMGEKPYICSQCDK